MLLLYNTNNRKIFHEVAKIYKSENRLFVDNLLESLVKKFPTDADDPPEATPTSTPTVQGGKAGNPAFEIDICGEQGGEPKSIDFCYRIGLDYVSCSPLRVPVARLAAAHTVINNGARK